MMSKQSCTCKQVLKTSLITLDSRWTFDLIYNLLQIADYIIDPMCRGIFAGDIKKLSVKSCLPMVYNLEENSGSIVKGVLFGKSK